LIKQINENTKCVVSITLTTFNEELCRKLEPNVSTTLERFNILEIMRNNGIPTVVWLCPILPFINGSEENLRGILDYCVRAKVKGIIGFGFGTTMRDGSREHFYSCLDKLFPGMKQKYIKTYGSMYECPSPNNLLLSKIFKEVCAKHGIMHDTDEIFEYLQKYESKVKQTSFLD